MPREEAHRYGVLDMDSSGQITDFQEKPAQPRSPWVSMGIYVFNRDVLVQALQDDADDEASKHDFGRDIIPRLYQTHRVFGYQYLNYWRDVGTLESYWSANMDLISARPELQLDDPEIRLRTPGSIQAPAHVGPRAVVQDSLLSAGARIEGMVLRSVAGMIAALFIREPHRGATEAAHVGARRR